MPIQKDPKGVKNLKATIGVRLRAARRSASLSQQDAARSIGHKGVTQISLAEDGKRVPPLIDLIKLADLYCVPVDFIVGRIDDPIAEAEEHNSGLVVRAVADSIAECVKTFTKGVADHVGVVMSGHREDRADLEEVIRIGEELRESIKRVQEINPKYDDLKGASKFDLAADKIERIGARLKVRVKREKSQREMIDTVLHLEKTEASLKQFTLDFKFMESCATA